MKEKNLMPIWKMIEGNIAEAKELSIKGQPILYDPVVKNEFSLSTES